MRNATKKDVKIVTNNPYINIKELMEITGCGYTKCWSVIKKINDELAEQGYITFPGKAPRKYVLRRLGLEA